MTRPKLAYRCAKCGKEIKLAISAIAVGQGIWGKDKHPFLCKDCYESLKNFLSIGSEGKKGFEKWLGRKWNPDKPYMEKVIFT